MAEIFDCKNPGCAGVIDANNFFFPPVRGCTISHLSYACPVCGLVHWPDGQPKSFTQGLMAFRLDGKIIEKEPENPAEEGWDYD